MPLDPPWHLIPKTLPEVRRLLVQRGLLPFGDRPYDAVIHSLNLSIAELEPLTQAIGPGWRVSRDRVLAHGRVVVDLLPPRTCPFARPAPKKCEPQPAKVSPRAFLAATAALVASVGVRGRR